MRIRIMAVNQMLAAALAVSLALLVCGGAAAQAAEKGTEDAKKTAEAAATKAPASPQETLTQYVADLQKKPKDGALRAKIISLVLAMAPKPPVPEEARKYMARGMAAIEEAKTEADFKDAAAEFSKVVNLAPWLDIGYRNLAIVQDKAREYQAALNSLGWYLATKPAPDDLKFANDLRAKIEFRKEKAAKDAAAEVQRRANEQLKAEEERKAQESSPEALAAKKQKEEDEWLKTLDGARFVCGPMEEGSLEQNRIMNVLEIRGKDIFVGRIYTKSKMFPENVLLKSNLYGNDVFHIAGRQFVVPLPSWSGRKNDVGTISDDGKFINFKWIEFVYKRAE